MRRVVTIGLVDLKKLVGICIDQKAEARAQVMALSEPGQSRSNSGPRIRWLSR